MSETKKSSFKKKLDVYNSTAMIGSIAFAVIVMFIIFSSYDGLAELGLQIKEVKLSASYNSLNYMPNLEAKTFYKKAEGWIQLGEYSHSSIIFFDSVYARDGIVNETITEPSQIAIMFNPTSDRYKIDSVKGDGALKIFDINGDFYDDHVMVKNVTWKITPNDIEVGSKSVSVSAFPELSLNEKWIRVDWILLADQSCKPMITFADGREILYPEIPTFPEDMIIDQSEVNKRFFEDNCK